MRTILLVLLLIGTVFARSHVNPRYFDIDRNAKIAALTNDFYHARGAGLKDRFDNYAPPSLEANSKKRDLGFNYPYLPSPTASSTFYFYDVYAVGEATYYETFPGTRDHAGVQINPTPIPVVVAVNIFNGTFIQYDAFDGEIVTPQGYWIWFVNASSGQIACLYDPSNITFVQDASAMIMRRDNSPDFDQTTISYSNNGRTCSYKADVWSTAGLNVDPGRDYRGAIMFNYMIDAYTNQTLFYRFDETPTIPIQQAPNGQCPFSQNFFIGASYDFRTANSTILPLTRAPPGTFVGHPSCHINNDVSKPLNTNLQRYTVAICGMC